MRKFVGFLSVIFVLGLAISAGKRVDATSSGQAQDPSEAVIARAKRQLEKALRDPEKVAVMRCLGVHVADQSNTPSPTKIQCETILALASETSPNQKKPVLRDSGTNGAPALQAYIEMMVRFQINYETAFHAAICRLRSDGYFNTFRAAQTQLSQQEAKRLGLSNAEIATAYNEINRQFAELHLGIPDFDIIKGCEFLRNSSLLNELDALQRNLTSNYH